MVNEVNSSSDGDMIEIGKSDRLANIPDHAFKLRMQYDVTPN